MIVINSRVSKIAYAVWKDTNTNLGFSEWCSMALEDGIEAFHTVSYWNARARRR